VVFVAAERGFVVEVAVGELGQHGMQLLGRPTDVGHDPVAVELRAPEGRVDDVRRAVQALRGPEHLARRLWAIIMWSRTVTLNMRYLRDPAARYAIPKNNSSRRDQQRVLHGDANRLHGRRTIHSSREADRPTVAIPSWVSQRGVLSGILRSSTTQRPPAERASAPWADDLTGLRQQRRPRLARIRVTPSGSNRRVGCTRLTCSSRWSVDARSPVRSSPHGAEALSAGGRWVVLDLKIPDNTPRWLTQLGIATVGRSASLEEWIVRRPWEAIRVAMQDTLA